MANKPDKRKILQTVVDEIREETGEEWILKRFPADNSDQTDCLCAFQNLNPEDYRIVKIEIPPFWYQDADGTAKIRQEIREALMRQ